jgi:NAD(P)-dependent dehydrogenase (short-subunit alcohol dehydrogenase family)
MNSGLSIVDRPALDSYRPVIELTQEPIMKTVLITGCSSGYGLATARLFHAKGWSVIATMRTPTSDVLPPSERMRVLALDVTQPETISAALQACGPIDVLVNNAGIGMFGAFEATSMETVRRLFETNTFGAMAMTQAVLPQMRTRRSGVVVNVTSSATLMPMPLVAAYTASKAAMEGFTGSLAYELQDFGIRVKLVEPGYGPSTRFTQNTPSPIQDAIPLAYAPFAQSVLAAFAQPAAVTTADDVAEVVWRAANDVSDKLRYPAGPDAVALSQRSAAA